MVMELEQRVCCVCGRHESNHPEMKWTKTPPIRAYRKERFDIDTDCWDDLTDELREHIAGQDIYIEELKKRLEDARKGTIFGVGQDEISP